MKKLLFVSVLLASAVALQPVTAQNSPFEFTALEEGLEAARESEQIVLVYLYDEEGGGISAYNRIWADPLVDHYTKDLTVMIAIDAESEEGEAFVKHQKKRLGVKANAPGVYFFSETGRSLGNVQGSLASPEAPGRILMALGAATYARDAGKQQYAYNDRHRWGRRPWY